MNLNQKQLKAVKAVRDNYNVFITGPAGTGKSYLINYLNEEFDVDVTASTGIASTHIGGQTIFSWGGYYPAWDDYDQKLIPFIRKRIENCSRLIIDEISMLDKKFFDFLDYSLKKVRESSRAFGGIQLIVVGDFLQLPPPSPKAQYCFESDSWRAAQFEYIKLNEIKRQESKEMSDMLNRIQIDEMTYEDKKLLMQKNIKDSFSEKCVQIFPLNKYADKVNQQKLLKINSEQFNFPAKWETGMKGRGKKMAEVAVGKFLKNSLLEECLKIKEGARVMLLVNDYINDCGISNGSTGFVTAIYDDEFIEVRFDNGSEVMIPRKEYDIKMKDVETREEKKIATLAQFPLKLCWAITVHKSQGMTLDHVGIDFKGMFSPFQAYVALSRARDLKGLEIKNFTLRYVKSDEIALAFMNSIK